MRRIPKTYPRWWTGRRGLTVSSLAVVALFVVTASAVAAPLGLSDNTPNESRTYFEQTGLRDTGLMGDTRIGVIGRNRVPERSPSFPMSTVIVFASLIGLAAFIALGTAVADRRQSRLTAELASRARILPREHVERSHPGDRDDKAA